MKPCLGRAVPSIHHATSSFQSTYLEMGTHRHRATLPLRRTAHASAGDTFRQRCDCQHRLLTKLGVRRISLILGWSMAAMQAYQWAAQYPTWLRLSFPICGAARCSPLTPFLDGPKAALQADAVWNEGDCAAPPEKGLRAFARGACALGLLFIVFSARPFIENLVSQRWRISCAIGRKTT